MIKFSVSSNLVISFTLLIFIHHFAYFFFLFFLFIYFIFNDNFYCLIDNITLKKLIALFILI